MIEIQKQALIESSSRMQPLEELDVAVLHRSARCDVMPVHTMILCPASIAFEVNSVPLSETI